MTGHIRVRVASLDDVDAVSELLPIFNSCGGFSGDRPLILQAFSR
jgi:hypothetical protein